MRWLFAKLLWLPQAWLVWVLYSVVSSALAEGQPLTSDGVIEPIIGVIIFVVMVSAMQNKLLEGRPRRRKLSRPKPSPRPAAIAQTAPVAPQKLSERRFAPIPWAESVEHDTMPQTATLPDRLRSFIVNGDQAIHAPLSVQTPPASSEEVPAPVEDGLNTSDQQEPPERGRYIPAQRSD